ncbi:MAG: ribosome maturation factor RimP [Pseudomonadota bacterium]
MTLEEKIEALIEPGLKTLGFEIVRVKPIGDDILQIMLDSEQGVGIEDCSKATKLIRNILHVSEMGDLYSLEVSSPGLDRPLIKPEHYTRFVGKDVKIKTNILVEGQKRFVGKLTNFDLKTNQITLTCEDKILNIEFEQVQAANLYYKFN